MLLKKLGLTQYEKKLSVAGSREISLVKIPLQKHWGAHSQARVKLGQRVRRGDVIAESLRDEQGSMDHASIHGTISNITEHFVEITGLPA